MWTSRITSENLRFLATTRDNYIENATIRDTIKTWKPEIEKLLDIYADYSIFSYMNLLEKFERY